MSRLGDEIASGLLELEDDLGSPLIVWNGTNYACTPARSTMARMLADGGFAPTNAMGFYVRRSRFGAVIPKSRERITYAGTTLQIADVTASPDGGYIFIDCDDPSKGA